MQAFAAKTTAKKKAFVKALWFELEIAWVQEYLWMQLMLMVTAKEKKMMKASVWEKPWGLVMEAGLVLALEWVSVWELASMLGLELLWVGKKDLPTN